MIPRLSRFYPCPHPSGNWLKVELRLFRCYVEMLPRLRAEEQLAAIQTGHSYTERPMDQQARGRYVSELERARSGESRDLRRMDKGILAAMAMGMGGVVVRRVGQTEEE